jgi:D-alanyl-D-alanine carboxypeptidase
VTVAVAALACALAVLGSALAADLATAASRRARAQTAADAAALAAVSESAPGGGAAPARAARLYAARNGARLLSCDCPAGTTEATARVEVAGFVASARAVFDPQLLEPARWTPGVDGLDPALRRAVRRLVDAAAGAVWIVSGYRSHAHQARLWAAALARYGSAEAADDWVAPPGTSMHERGLAVDLGGDLDRAAALVARLDLPMYRPLANEPWHFELAGSR